MPLAQLLAEGWPCTQTAECVLMLAYLVKEGMATYGQGC